MNEFEKRIKEIFTGSVAYDEYRGFIEANLAEIIAECRKEFPECYEISSTRLYDVHEIKEWYKRWFINEDTNRRER